MTELETLQKRLANTETCLVGLWHLMQDTFPPAYQEDIHNMMDEYFDANLKLGAIFNIKDGFK